LLVLHKTFGAIYLFKLQFFCFYFLNDAVLIHLATSFSSVFKNLHLS